MKNMSIASEEPNHALYTVPAVSKPISEAMEAHISGDGLPYRLYLPEGYDAGGKTKYSLLLFLHGAGERGDDNTQSYTRNTILLQRIIDHEVYSKDCILVVPQCPVDQQWVNTPWENGDYDASAIAISGAMQKVLTILDEVKATVGVDEKRMYVSGASMGGFGAWYLLMTRPEMFAAGVPICGGADSRLAEKVVVIPIWTFHGSVDPTVPVSGTRSMVDAIKAAGGNKITYTEYPGMAHDVWDKAHSHADLLDWLFAQSK